MILTFDGQTEEIYYSDRELDKAIAKVKEFLEASKTKFANAEPNPYRG